MQKANEEKRERNVFFVSALYCTVIQEDSCFERIEFINTINSNFPTTYLVSINLLPSLLVKVVRIDMKKV